MKRAQWTIDYEKETGLKWDDLDLIDKLQWQKRYPRGRWLLSVPICPRAKDSNYLPQKTGRKANDQ